MANSARTSISSFQFQAVNSAADAINMASIAKSYIEELGFILAAIKQISEKATTVHGLAIVGCRLADSHYDIFGCELPELERKHAELKGGAA